MSISNPLLNTGGQENVKGPVVAGVPGNIWRVEKESHIDKIILSNKDKIVMVTFSYGDPRLKIFLKRQLAVQFPNCCFVLALVDIPGGEKKYNFIADKGTYIQELKGKQLPFVFFYYDAKYIVTIASAEPSVIVNALKKFITMANPKPGVAPGAGGVNMQNQIQQNKLAHEYVIEKMAQQHKIHDLEELQKIQKIQEAQENERGAVDKSDSQDGKGKSKVKKRDE
ncbi:MAG: hypothetical protein Hyperionvirus44_8 [Hyperionvirus sp.]|uniref:Uncharacterized protein n=1 Tax=Hyperionvirus sp. TaxID=2487770 RepID=A0A3G5ACF7_9VIRU|nr:MAG: hypothetical protein Hyperionvirus44_8 [Hyperionvirus sp.]